MKIICIGRNYVDHAKELNNAVPTEPVVFMKPDSSIVLKGKPFFIPNFSKEVHHELELVVRINRIGKFIEKEFAKKYYDEVTVGVDFTARDVQKKLKEKGLPWEKAKGFDGSAPVGEFIKLNQLRTDINNIDIKLLNNGVLVQSGNTNQMLFDVDSIISYVSQFYTLKIGDLIFTGTPAGVAKVKIGDNLEGFIGDKKLLNVPIR